VLLFCSCDDGDGGGGGGGGTHWEGEEDPHIIDIIELAFFLLTAVIFIHVIFAVVIWDLIWYG
jgi:hypothetical protein